VVFVEAAAFLYTPFQALAQSLGSGLGSVGVLTVDILLLGGLPVVVIGGYLVLQAWRSDSEALSESPVTDHIGDQKDR
jgi:hypothetical protein